MEDVRNFLIANELSHYVKVFEEKGYDSMKFFMDLSSRKLRITTKKLKMLEGHADRFIEGIEYQKKSWTYQSQKNCVRNCATKFDKTTCARKTCVKKSGGVFI